MQTVKIKELRIKLTRIFFQWQHGWKLCTVKVSDFSDKYKKIILDNLGNHPLGDYVILDDCACQMDGGGGDFVLYTSDNKYYGDRNPQSQADMCKCECHKSIAELVEIIIKEFEKDGFI